MITPIALYELAPPDGWRATSRPRIEPLRQKELGAGTRLLVWLARRRAARQPDAVEVPRELPSIVLLLMRHRRLFGPWLRFAARLMPYGTLDRCDVEIAILRVGWNCRCRYEWGQHVQIGLSAGLSAEQIAGVAQGPLAPIWGERHAALLQSCDELHRERCIGEATWRRLELHYGQKQLIEIGLLIGHYEMLAGLLNSVGLPLEAEVERALRGDAV